MTTQTQTRSEGKRPQAGDAARAALLAALPMGERQMLLAGLSTAVLEGGEGPPVVLLHGPGAHAGSWLRVIPDLAAKHRVVVPDLPGHGGSATPGAPPSAARVLAWLGELIERTCATPPALVGEIVGGAIAARFAAAHPGRLRRLVLVDTLGLVPFQPAPAFGLALGEYLARPSGETHDRLWRHCAYDLDAVRKGLGERWDRLRAYNLDRALAPDLHATQRSVMEQFGLPAIDPDELARITVPTTLVWGRHDIATPLAAAQAASARYGWALHVIDDCAVEPAMEQPAPLLEVLSRVLADAKGEGGAA